MIHTKYWAESAFRWSLLLCAGVVIAELGSTTILKINKIKIKKTGLGTGHCEVCGILCLALGCRCLLVDCCRQLDLLVVEAHTTIRFPKISQNGSHVDLC